MEGPVRDDEKQAAQDLSSIRAAADGEATRLAKLQAMQLAAKQLRDGAKAAARGESRKSRRKGTLHVYSTSTTPKRKRSLVHAETPSAAHKQTSQCSVEQRSGTPPGLMVSVLPR